MNVEPYTKEGLDRIEQEKQNATVEGNDSSSSSSSTSQQQQQIHPPEYYNYSLTGVLVHTGTSESGHYYSYIQDPQSKNWFEFNDDNVMKFNPNEIPSSCYGGPHSDFDPNLASARALKASQKPYNAYLLFYERKDKLEHQTIPKEDMVKSIPKPLFESVWQQNIQLLIDKNLFDKEYQRFVDMMVKFYAHKAQAGPSGRVNNDSVPAMLDRSYKEPFLAVAKLGLTYITQVLSHASDKKQMLTSVSESVCFCFVISLFFFSSENCSHFTPLLVSGL